MPNPDIGTQLGKLMELMMSPITKLTTAFSESVTNTFKPLLTAVEDIILPLKILRESWVPVYDPITNTTYNTLNEYLTMLPQMLQKIGEAGQQAQNYAEKVKKGII